jgi:hypothetical protein
MFIGAGVISKASRFRKSSIAFVYFEPINGFEYFD